MFQGKKDMKYCTYVDGYMQIYKVIPSTSKSSQYQNLNIILNNNLIPNYTVTFCYNIKILTTSYWSDIFCCSAEILLDTIS